MLIKINEALELALAAIDKETTPQLQQQPQTLQQQPENSYPITAPSSNTNTNKQNNNNNTLNQIETDVVEVVEQQQQQDADILINKTDEEKCEKLKMEEIFQTTTTTNTPTILEIKEKSEEEISKEPIYENIISTTSMAEVDVALNTKTTVATATTTTTTKTTLITTAYQQQQHQIIPSMISNEIDKTSSIDSKQNQNYDTNNQNQNQNQLQIQNLSNQLKNSQINCQINNNNINNNNNNNNYNNNNNKTINNTSSNVAVELTNNAFANATITTKIKTQPTATTTINSDQLSTNITTNLLTEITFNHLKQPSSSSSSNIKQIEVKNTTAEIKNDTAAAEKIPDVTNDLNSEPYYQVPKSIEPYYDNPKHLKPVPVYENIEIFFNGNMTDELSNEMPLTLQPPKEKPPPPPVDSPPLFDDVDSSSHTDTWSSDNTYETLSRHQLNHHHHHHNHHLSQEHPSPPIKRMNSTKRIKKELRNKRSSFLGIEGSSLDDDESYLELTVAPPPDMAQLLQEERRLEKQLYLKAGLCDSSDTGESRDSGVSENHSRQSSEHYTNSSEENEPHDDTTSPLTLQTQTGLDAQPNDILYQNDGLLAVAPTPLLQTVKGNSAESWTESATVAAAATQSLTEATATANAKMMSIEEKIREQEEVLRVERELLQLEQEELKRQRENLMLRENMARRELQHGAKMLMSANRRSLQDLNGLGAMTVVGNVNIGETQMPPNNLEMYHQQMNHGRQGVAGQLRMSQQQQQQQMQQGQQPTQQIYANIPNLQQQYYHMETDYRKSMSDINEFSKRMMSQPPAPPSKPMRAMHINTSNANANANGMIINGASNIEPNDYNARQRHSLNLQHFGGSLVKIAAETPTAAPRAAHIYSNYHHQSVQNLSSSTNATQSNANSSSLYPGNMSRNTLHALSATPKPKYTDGWVQVQQRKSFDSNLANDPAWVSAYQQKRKSMPDSYHGYNQNNHWLIQEAEQRRLTEQQLQQQQRRTISSNNTPVHQGNNMLSNGSVMLSSSTNGKPLPDSIIQTLTERVQSKGIGERKRNNLDKSPLHMASTYHQHQQQQQQQQQYNKLNQQQQSSTNNAIYRHNNIITTSATTNSSSTSSTSCTNGQSNITTTQQQQQEKVLSVSGKKKCSHCGDELGRGAAMIIESLLLFYHINCFKCCVCHVQLGDGLNGTDVRVRNHKLHCQNCYSSDDGIKFSCV